MKYIMLGILFLSLTGCGCGENYVPPPIGTIETLTAATPEGLQLQLNQVKWNWKVKSVTKIDQLYVATVVKTQLDSKIWP